MFTINPPRALWALIATLLALALFMNGVAMMGAPLSWYGFIQGVAETGPFNEHFVSDVGAAYVAAAVSLAFAVGRLERAAAAPAAAFLALHALIHLIPLLGAQRLAGIFVCQPPERAALLGEIVGPTRIKGSRALSATTLKRIQNQRGAQCALVHWSGSTATLQGGVRVAGRARSRVVESHSKSFRAASSRRSRTA